MFSPMVYCELEGHPDRHPHPDFDPTLGRRSVAPLLDRFFGRLFEAEISTVDFGYSNLLDDAVDSDQRLGLHHSGNAHSLALPVDTSAAPGKSQPADRHPGPGQRCHPRGPTGSESVESGSPSAAARSASVESVSVCRSEAASRFRLASPSAESASALGTPLRGASGALPPAW